MFNSASSKAAISRPNSEENSNSTTSNGHSVKGNPCSRSKARARSGSSTTNRMIELSVVSSTVRASTWTWYESNKEIKSCSRPNRFGVNTDNCATGSARFAGVDLSAMTAVSHRPPLKASKKMQRTHADPGGTAALQHSRVRGTASDTIGMVPDRRLLALNRDGIYRAVLP
jgi:hypothetical protein